MDKHSILYILRTTNKKLLLAETHQRGKHMLAERSSPRAPDEADLLPPSIALEEALSSISDGVVIVDLSGTIVFVNPAYSRIMNVPASQALGKKMRDITPNAHTLRVLETGEPLLFDTHFSRDLGLDVVMSATPILRNRRMVGVVTIFRTSHEMLELYSAYRRAHGLADYYWKMASDNGNDIGDFARIVGRDGALSATIRLASRVAETDATVLVTGENGVGKDILCQAIHFASNRKQKPFIVVNCAAIPDSLLESELFGFDQGSFTGAARGGKLGKFELAHGGTIFLDEIGDTSLSMQAKLLRTLQNGEVQRIGSNKLVSVDVRVMAATNKPLEYLVSKGLFREDLFYRINVFPIEIPPLRERKSDIPALANYFLKQLSQTYRRKLLFAPEAFRVLERYDWPGNVRQLRNVIERAVILCDGDILLPDHIQGISISDGSEEHRSRGELRNELRKIEHNSYKKALAAHGGNKTKAMKSLGVSRRTFYKKLREFGLS